jgi:TPR repeat protein
VEQAGNEAGTCTASGEASTVTVAIVLATGSLVALQVGILADVLALAVRHVRLKAVGGSGSGCGSGTRRRARPPAVVASESVHWHWQKGVTHGESLQCKPGAGGKHAEGVALLREAAAAGHAFSATLLGVAYMNGDHGLAVDNVEAGRWLQRAAGDALGMGMLAPAFSNAPAFGLGPDDDGKAAQLEECAAMRGDPRSLFARATALASGGKYAPANPARAGKLMRMAAEAPYAPAMHAYGCWYSLGFLVPQSMSACQRRCGGGRRAGPWAMMTARCSWRSPR